MRNGAGRPAVPAPRFGPGRVRCESAANVRGARCRLAWRYDRNSSRDSIVEKEIDFAPEDIAYFAQLSHDRNPLHCDYAYSRRTPFGRVVTHGVAVVLRMLGEWAQGRSFRLLSLSAEFKNKCRKWKKYLIPPIMPAAQIRIIPRDISSLSL